LNTVELTSTETLGAARAQDLRAWLVDAFDGNFTDEDWAHTIGGVHALIQDRRGIVSHGAIVARSVLCDGHSLCVGYLEAVATRPDQRRHGYASRVLRKLGEIIARDYDIGALSTSLQAVYAPLGWESWHGPSYVQTPHRRVRTADEDGGLMVLRTPRTPPVNIGGDIVADWRTGDVW